MTEQYTPTTGTVRGTYAGIAYTGRGHDARLAEFDRWLAAHDAQVAAKAIREAAADIEDIFIVQRSILDGTTYEWLRDRADRIEGGTDA